MPNITVNGTILLPPDMYWVDEHNWSAVHQKVDTSVTGAAIIQMSKRTEGRTITLKSDQECAWLTRAQLEDLKTLEATLEDFSLEMGDGTTFNVMFAGGERGDAIMAEAIQPGKEPAPGDYFIATLKFMEITA